MLKDLRLAQEAALRTGANMPLGAEATRNYALFNALGRGAGFSGIIQVLSGAAEEP